MKCSDIQSNLALHASGMPADATESNPVTAHLEVCPLCRQRYADLRELNAGLRKIKRPEISAALKNSIKQNLRTELRISQKSWLPISPDIREWLILRVMPSTVGVC